MTLEDAISDVNPVLRGWGRYFQVGNSAQKFHEIDSYADQRLALLASRKHGLTGRNWGRRFNYEWYSRLGVYRLTGTVRYTNAYARR